MKTYVMTKQIFEKHCACSIDAESEIFNNLSEYFKLSWILIIDKLLGHPLEEQLVELFESESEGELDEIENDWIQPMTMSEIKETLDEYICNYSLWRAIPHLDLVLTNNGFGVVSSNNIVPAIPERVNRLSKSCKCAADAAFDKLIKGLPGNSLTKNLLKEGKRWQKLTNHLIWTTDDYIKWCSPKNYEKNDRWLLMENKGCICTVEAEMSEIISQEQFQTFIRYIQGEDWNDTIDTAIQLLMQWFASAFYNKCTTPNKHADALLAFMDRNITHFSDYANSDQYAARNYQSYQTSEKDGCFIFR